MTSNWYISSADASRLIGVRPGTIWKWGDDGRIRTSREGRYTLYCVADLLEVQRERELLEALLAPPEAARLVGVKAATLRKHARDGKLPAHKAGIFFGFRREDVVEYWRVWHRRRCLRCGILEEATPERGFMCKACEYEHRTGRIYKYPCCPPARNGDMPRGRLALQGG